MDSSVRHEYALRSLTAQSEINAGLAVRNSGPARRCGASALGSPADYGKLFVDEIEKWGKVIRGQHQGRVSQAHRPHTFTISRSSACRILGLADLKEAS